MSYDVCGLSLETIEKRLLGEGGPVFSTLPFQTQTTWKHWGPGSCPDSGHIRVTHKDFPYLPTRSLSDVGVHRIGLVGTLSRLTLHHTPGLSDPGLGRIGTRSLYGRDPESKEWTFYPYYCRGCGPQTQLRICHGSSVIHVLFTLFNNNVLFLPDREREE